MEVKKSKKKFVVTVLLSFLFGPFGFHRFYVGQIKTGFLMLMTAGGMGFWALIDFITVICGVFRDKEGKVVSIR